MNWTDTHNHLQDSRLPEKKGIIREMKAVGISRCVVNATSEEDWEAVEKLAQAEPGFVFPAFGIHPWKAHLAKNGWQQLLIALLEKHPVASIGECGVDRWVSQPSLEIQLPVFTDQLRIARELERPASIHCLKAWDALFAAFQKEPPPERFLMHSFGGSIEIARRLIPLGAYFSFSGYFLHPKKQAVLEVYRQLPPERIVLETDAPDMLPPAGQITHSLSEARNHPANLPAIGTRLAEALGMTADALAAITQENAAHLFPGRAEPPSPLA